jgi:transposase InsO family protein
VVAIETPLCALTIWMPTSPTDELAAVMMAKLPAATLRKETSAPTRCNTASIQRHPGQQRRNRDGGENGGKPVYRLLREDNLLCVRKRKFVVTTDSNHGRKVYPNLAAAMALTGVDQLWRADITYIRLREEFVFLAVILDAFSRRMIGWALDRNMEEELTLTALDQYRNAQG